MQWQGPVRTEHPKRVLLEPHGLILLSLESTDLRGRKGERRSLSQAHGLIRCLTGFTQARSLGKRLLEQAQGRKQRELLRPLRERLEERHVTWRRPVLTGHALTSPRAADFRRI